MPKHHPHYPRMKRLWFQAAGSGRTWELKPQSSRHFQFLQLLRLVAAITVGFLPARTTAFHATMSAKRGVRVCTNTSCRKVISFYTPGLPCVRVKCPCVAKMIQTRQYRIPTSFMYGYNDGACAAIEKLMVGNLLRLSSTLGCNFILVDCSCSM